LYVNNYPISNFSSSNYCVGSAINYVKITPTFSGIYSADNNVNNQSSNDDKDITGNVGTQFPIVLFDKGIFGQFNDYYNIGGFPYNQNATLSIPNTTGSFSTVTGKMTMESFVPDDGQNIPANSVLGYTKAKLDIGNNFMYLPVNFSPIGGAGVLGSQNIIAPYITNDSNYINFQIGSQAPNIPLINSTVPNGTIAILEIKKYYNNVNHTYTGTIQNGAFVPNANQSVVSELSGKFVGKLRIVGATTGVLVNYKSLINAYVPPVVGSSVNGGLVTTPIKGTASQPFPSFALAGTTLSNGDILTVTIPGSQTTISGTFQNGFFVPNAGTIPNPVPTFTTSRD
jgi:hypothetical protein